MTKLLCIIELDNTLLTFLSNAALNTTVAMVKKNVTFFPGIGKDGAVPVSLQLCLCCSRGRQEGRHTLSEPKQTKQLDVCEVLSDDSELSQHGQRMSQQIDSQNAFSPTLKERNEVLTHSKIQTF